MFICKNCRNFVFAVKDLPQETWGQEIGCCSEPYYQIWIYGDPEYDKENRGFDVVDGVVEKEAAELEILRDKNEKE